MERLLPIPLSPINPSGSTPKIQRRLPDKGAAATLIMIHRWSDLRWWIFQQGDFNLGTTREYSLHCRIIPVEVPVPNETFIVDILIG
mmetsp:Transcript_13186/g.19637  ORF Transcript_13186/g.19637 Transcript_13186/m.19637 type:complete len:87 (+) Transcript_13186:288-548(+)